MKKLWVIILFWTLIISWCSNSSDNDYILEDNYNYFVDEDYDYSYNDYDYDDYDDYDYETDYTYDEIQTKWNADYITVKYRDTMVDVSGFETFNTSKSSFIEKAYYDRYNQYLILNLDWTYYHWCGVPAYVREDFKNSDSLWWYYNKYLKWEYDCRIWYVPQYN